MKALKTILALVFVGLIVYFVLTLIMPKIAFKQKKAIIDAKQSSHNHPTLAAYAFRVSSQARLL